MAQLGSMGCRIGFSASPGGTQAPGLHSCPSWPCRECNNPTVQVWEWLCPAHPTASLPGWGHNWKCCLITYLMTAAWWAQSFLVINDSRERRFWFSVSSSPIPRLSWDAPTDPPWLQDHPVLMEVWSPAGNQDISFRCTLRIQIQMQMETHSSASPATNMHNSLEQQGSAISKWEQTAGSFSPGIYAQVSLPHSLLSSQTKI